MEKNIAENLMNDLVNLNVSMNRVAMSIEKINVESQKLKFRRNIADLMGVVYTDLMRPIIQEYPELNPDV